MPWASWQLPTRHKPRPQGGEVGRPPHADTRQKREEQTIASHRKDNAWEWKHGAKETKPWMKEEGGGGRDIFLLKYISGDRVSHVASTATLLSQTCGYTAHLLRCACAELHMATLVENI